MAKKLKGVTFARQNKWYADHISSIESGIYQPFWRVEDIKSAGIKVKIRAFNQKSRVVHLFSMNELFMYQLIAWDLSIVESYEQFALPLETTLAIADELEIKHPVYSDTRIPIIQTIDFMCVRDDESQVAFLVKQESALEKVRTLETLSIQEAYCVISDIDYQIVSSEELKTEQCQNLERLYKHSELSDILVGVFKVWISNFVGVLSDDRHEKAANILDRSAELTGIPYQRAAHFLYHAIWTCQLTFNWGRPLALEFPASVLELSPAYD